MKDLRTELLTKLGEVMPQEQLVQVSIILDTTLYDFDITPKSRELALNTDTDRIILKNFLGMKKLEGKSDGTIAAYRHILSKFLDSIPKSVTQLDVNDIRYYLAEYQQTRNVKTSTLNTMRNYYSSFFTWMWQEGYISSNPMSRIPSFKVPAKKVDAFTESELEKLFSAATTIRDRALLEFLYSTGMRAMECANTNISDIDFIKGIVVVRHGKGDKERNVYISDKARIWLERYILEERKGVGQDALWLGKQGRLSVGGIEDVVKKIGKRAGVEKAHPHRFRHTLATNMVKRGAPLQQVQLVLGHEDISTTMIYVDINDTDVKNTHNKLIA